MLVLRDHSGNRMTVVRNGNFLQFILECDVGVTSFEASATHMGKILTLIVDQFFPDGTADEYKTQSP